MKVVVVRSVGGTRPASETIIDPLCSEERVCVARGKAFLYANGFEILRYTMTTPFRSVLLSGDIVEMRDGSLGEVFRSRVVGGAISAVANENGHVEVMNSLSIERYKEES